MDMQADRVADLLPDPRFHFFEGDITINKEWIEYHIKKCDVVLPLVAIATPATYVREPLRVFELDFEANLPIVRAVRAVPQAHRLPVDLRGLRHVPGRRIRSGDLGAGPGPDQQAALDLFLRQAAHGSRDPRLRHAGRTRLHAVPAFNWIGAGLDSINTAKEGSSRVITQFLGHIVRGEDIKLVDGGTQKRAFTYIDDGIDALVKIIAKHGRRGEREDLQHRQSRQQLFGAGARDSDARRSPRTIPEYRDTAAPGAPCGHYRRRLTTAAATRTSRTACRRSTTPVPTSDWQPRVTMDEALRTHLRRLPRAGDRGAAPGRLTRIAATGGAAQRT